MTFKKSKQLIMLELRSLAGLEVIFRSEFNYLVLGVKTEVISPLQAAKAIMHDTLLVLK